jgi:hypothetical protein
LGFSDIHGRVPNGTLGSERVKRKNYELLKKENSKGDSDEIPNSPFPHGRI